MVQELFCTLSNDQEVEAAVRCIKTAGLDLKDLTLAVQPEEIDRIAHPPLETYQSLKRGILCGATLGFLIGVSLVIYSNSPAFSHSEGVLSIPLIFAGGWAIFGAIVGSTGLLSRRVLSTDLQAHFEEEVGHGKQLLAVRLHSPGELKQISGALGDLGASDLRVGSLVA